MTSPAPPQPELFHSIADPGSAAARRLYVELGLDGAVRLRNTSYEEVAADWSARGGTITPAWWDGTTLIEGEEQVVAAMMELAARRAR